MPVRSRGARSPGGTAIESAAPEWVLAGRALLQGRVQSIEIAIDATGTIVAVGKDLRGPRRRDVGDLMVLPSATDLHVHLRDPGPSREVESFAAGTIEAAAGGVGLVAEMPNTEPPVSDRERWEEKAHRARGRCAVDVLLYALAAPGVPIEALGRIAGGFKLYLSPTTGVSDPPSPGELAGILSRVAATDLPLSVHAEDPAHFAFEPPPHDLTEWNRARPPKAEASAVTTLLACAPPGLRLHVAHVTEAEVARRIARAGFSWEATPHHLLLPAHVVPPTHGKVNPPLRAEADRLALWETFRQGAVGCVASDHAPHSALAKDLPFEHAPSGLPGLETMVPLLLHRVRSAELSLERLVTAACERPARWLGQARGRIAVGHRADLLVVDFRRRRTITSRSLHAPCGWSPFEGWEAIFPVEHYRRGERIVEDGEYVGTPRGEVVRPEFARPPPVAII